MALEPENPAIGGTILRRTAIQSPDFVHDVQGYSINQDGTAEFNSLTFRGSFSGQDFVINDQGVLFYNQPAQGPDNLIASLSSGQFVDQWGNLVLGGSVTYEPIGGVFIAAQVTGRQILFLSAPHESGPWGVIGQITISSAGAMVIESSGAMLLQSLNGNIKLEGSCATSDSVYLESARVPSGAPPAAPAGTETWHPVTFANSWANTAGRTPAQYRYISSPPNNVEIIGGITAPAGIAANQTVFTLPAGYRVAHTQSILAVDVTTGGLVRLSPLGDGSGSINYKTGAAPGDEIDFHALLSLDA